MKQIAFTVPKPFQNNRLFDIDAARDRSLERFVLLKKILESHGLRCTTFDACSITAIDILVILDIHLHLRQIFKAIKYNPSIKLIYIATEPPLIYCLHDNNILGAMPFDRVLYWNDDYVKQYAIGVKCNIGQPIISQNTIPNIPFNKKKFLVAIYSNKLIKHKMGLYEERLTAFDFFYHKPEEFDLYGRGWENSKRPSVLASYKGKCICKKDVLKNYKFALCYENSRYPYYITEKIFDCFAAGTVPIYLGAPNIQNFIPKSCFIDLRDFKDYDELYHYLISMKESVYNSYLQAVKDFIQSPIYHQFTSQGFAELVSNQIFTLLNEPKHSRSLSYYLHAFSKIVLSNPVLFLKNFRSCRQFLIDLIISWKSI
ncbi:hypothetical protein DBT_0808 [Dissulfuribacter thermophilus]|uniref:Fucosyltransferase C-terminal domain-containing protein n=1 Tax=Dissulfuribacter thermophilus TaxID=1156395 RepID=A0A1B9F7M0_9BACT|nr:glycosyltransferase family 10 [Dissulfuribacter thermophilus]OCC15883.1 hypothetical protein DBT_0808 [Dissulfuribacter thermophilus]